MFSLNSKKLANTIDNQARRLVGKAYKETEALLKQHKDKLQLMAETLLQKEVLNYKDIEALIGPPPHGKKSLVEVFDLSGLIDEGVDKRGKKDDESNGPNEQRPEIDDDSGDKTKGGPNTWTSKM